MTEIQFLLDLILTGKLPKAAKEKCLARIGEVESKLTQPVQQRAPSAILTQPPSTQRLMESHIDARIVPPTPGKIDRETGSVMVNNGDGTIGKRKW